MFQFVTSQLVRVISDYFLQQSLLENTVSIATKESFVTIVEHKPAEGIFGELRNVVQLEHFISLSDTFSTAFQTHLRSLL